MTTPHVNRRCELLSTFSTSALMYSTLLQMPQNDSQTLAALFPPSRTATTNTIGLTLRFANLEAIAVAQWIATWNIGLATVAEPIFTMNHPCTWTYFTEA